VHVSKKIISVLILINIILYYICMCGNKMLSYCYNTLSMQLAAEIVCRSAKGTIIFLRKIILALLRRYFSINKCKLLWHDLL